MAELGAAFFEALFERQGDAIIVADDHAQIVRVNEAACSMLGRSREELESLTVPDIVVEDTPHDTQRLWGRFRDATQQRGRIKLRRGDGTDIIAEYVATASIRGGLHVSVLRDDVERHRDELVLRALTDSSAAIDSSLDPREIARRVARSVVKHIADWAVVDLRTPGGELRRSAIAHENAELQGRMWKKFGDQQREPSGPSEVVLRTGVPQQVEFDETLLSESIPPEARPDVRALGVRHALLVPIPSRRTSEPHGVLTLIQARSGRPLHRALRDAGSELGRRLGAALDRAQAYEELRRAYEHSESQRRILDAIMSNVPEGITIAEGREVKVRMVSRYGLESLGLDPDAALGSTNEQHPDVFHVIDPTNGAPRDPATLPLRRAIETGERVVGEHLTVERPDGYRVELLANAAPIRNADGEVVGGVLAWRDVTPLMDAERKLDEALRREREARRAAEEASRLKDQFLGSVSHELRTPLNAIYGWAQMLRSDGASRSEIEQGLAVIERNAKAQKELIDDLLDVSRIVSGNIRLELGPVDLRSVLDTAVASLEPQASARRVRLDCDVPEELPTVSGDVSRLQQVASNLISNAIKFTPEGGRISVSLAQLDGHVRLVVDDEGVGIEPDLLEHVFEPFRQAEGGSTRRHGGLGLGLAIVRELVRLHGGRIDARSDGPGRGASFTVELPIRPSRPVREHTDPGLAAPPPVLADLTGMRILLVEDDPDSRALVRRVLTRAGAEVREAESAAEALRAVRDDAPDVVVSDIGMPNMDGLELMRAMRDMDLDRQPPAVALTAYASDRDRREALSAGYQAHLTKPVEAPKLTSTVRRLVEKNPDA